jgi:hypothetical protein
MLINLFSVSGLCHCSLLFLLLLLMLLLRSFSQPPQNHLNNKARVILRLVGATSRGFVGRYHKDVPGRGGSVVVVAAAPTGFRRCRRRSLCASAVFCPAAFVLTMVMAQ